MSIDLLLNFIFTASLLVFIFTAYKKTIWAIAAIITLLPSYLWRFNILGMPTTFLELMIVLLFIIWLIKEKRYKKINFFLKRKSENQVPYKLRLLLSVWILASVLAWLVNPTYSALGLWRAYFLEPIMFFLVFIYTVKDKEDIKIIINGLGLLLAWLFVVAMYQNFTDWNYIAAYNFPHAKRLTAVFSYPNALALISAPISIFFLSLWLMIKNKGRNWHYLLLGILGVSLSYFAVSEGAMLAMLAAIFIWLILAKKTRKWGILLACLALSVIILFLPNSFYQLFSPGKGLDISSLEIRSWQWRETLAMLKDNFVLGSGLNGYQVAMNNYHRIDWIEIYLYPHNIFLNFWTEMGLLGLFGFLGLLAYIYYILKKILADKNIFAWPLILAWLTWFIHGLVDVPYFKNDLSILFFILLAFSLFVYKNKKDGGFEKIF
ncbi:O-antigen ligase family protein [Patescibacteria group bacterium]|nr:O-antigen ligase family protein [Patescibacteria group bacterium]